MSVNFWTIYGMTMSLIAYIGGKNASTRGHCRRQPMAGNMSCRPALRSRFARIPNPCAQLAGGSAK